MAFEAGTFASCKHCSGTKLQRKGIDNGRQRYRCAPCDYTFVSSVMVAPTTPPAEGVACDRCSGPVYPKGHDKHGRPRVSCIPCQHIFITAEHRPGKQPVFIEGVPCLICEDDKVVSAGFSNTGKKRYACVPCDYTFTAVEERIRPGPRLIGSRRPPKIAKPFRPKPVRVEAVKPAKEKRAKPVREKTVRAPKVRSPVVGNLSRLVRPKRPKPQLPRLLAGAKYSVLADLRPTFTQKQAEFQRLGAVRDICVGFVASATAVPAAMILSETRGETIHGDARHMAMYLMNTVLGETLSATAQAFYRDRCSVAYAVRRVEDARDYSHVDDLLARLEVMVRAVMPHLPPRPKPVKPEKSTIEAKAVKRSRGWGGIVNRDGNPIRWGSGHSKYF